MPRLARELRRLDDLGNINNGYCNRPIKISHTPHSDSRSWGVTGPDGNLLLWVYGYNYEGLYLLLAGPFNSEQEARHWLESPEVRIENPEPWAIFVDGGNIDIADIEVRRTVPVIV